MLLEDKQYLVINEIFPPFTTEHKYCLGLNKYEKYFFTTILFFY